MVMAGGVKRVLLVSLTLALVLVVATPASAAEVVYRHGTCSLGKSVYTVEFKNDFGPTLEVSAFVDTPVAGQAWLVNMRHNGKIFSSTLATTNAQGNFEVDAHHPAKPLMADALLVKAFNKVSGEICTARATLS
jgi:hypothetical protein